MKLHAGTCGLSEWQILSKKWQVPSTTINWTNSFKWKYTFLHAGMYGLSVTPELQFQIIIYTSINQTDLFKLKI